MELARERDPAADVKVIRTQVGAHLFVVDGSRLYDLEPSVAQALERALSDPDDPLLQNLYDGVLSGPPRIDGAGLEPPPMRSLSLNVAQGCNLACGYCYADAGAFGGRSRMMAFDIARASVDRLLDECEPGVDVVIGFMGGEPMLARELIHDIVPYATRAADAVGCRARFSLTTNATRLTAEDARLFAEHPFTISVSLDGPPALNDALRPLNSGGGSYEQVRRGLEHLLANRPRHLSGRITVTRRTLRMRPLLEHVMSLGFDDVGFAPVLSSPLDGFALRAKDLSEYLAGLIECAEVAKAKMKRGERFPFTNFEAALHEIHRGSHRPYPCGAGAAYLSVSAEGNLFACHRLIDDDSMAMGDVFGGSDVEARRAHLARRHVDRQEPCRSCWARYLCGGGCYHEVDRAGRPSCDMIRGWLSHCIAAYAELSSTCPGYFRDPDHFYRSPTTEARA